MKKDKALDNIYLTEFRKKLFYWYEKNKRDLTWRNTKDPYVIWISEIILQQTRVNQGQDYFNRFIEKFPSVKKLASSTEEEVLKMWQGLGYYTRARNIYATARIIKEKYKGIFPKEYNDIINLKGIGKYTASAITSFAYNAPYPVVDGNVYRFLSRLFTIDVPIDTIKGKKIFDDLAQELLDTESPGLHNQAMMEMGALVCKPLSPLCETCPFKETCQAFLQGKTADFPKKQNKNKNRDRYFHYLCIIEGDNTFIAQRKGEDIWKNLYEFPLIEDTKELEISDLFQKSSFRELFSEKDKVHIKQVSTLKKHILSHQTIYAKTLIININNENKLLSGYKKIKKTDILQYPVSRLMEIFIKEMDEFSF